MTHFTHTRLLVSTTIATAALLALQACSEGKTEPTPGTATTTEPAKPEKAQVPALVVPAGALAFGSATEDAGYPSSVKK